MITGVANLSNIPSNFQKKCEIPTYVTDKNTKFTTKSVHIVASVDIIYIEYLYAKFTSLPMHIYCSVYQKCSEFTVL